MERGSIKEKTSRLVLEHLFGGSNSCAVVSPMPVRSELQDEQLQSRLALDFWGWRLDSVPTLLPYNY
jgi:hypothetical protein